MTIIVPNTFDGLLNETKAMQDRLSGIAFGIASSASTAWQASYRLRKVVDVSLDYLYENPQANALNLSSSITDLPFEYTSAGYKALEPHFGDRKAVTEIHGNVAELAQAALDLRTPLGENKPARKMLQRIAEYMRSDETRHLVDNPVPAVVATCDRIYGGSDIPFLVLESGIAAMDAYLGDNKKNYPQLCKDIVLVSHLARDIMEQAEAHLPTPPVPAKPARQPIFERLVSSPTVRPTLA